MLSKWFCMCITHTNRVKRDVGKKLSTITHVITHTLLERKAPFTLRSAVALVHVHHLSNSRKMKS